MGSEGHYSGDASNVSRRQVRQSSTASGPGGMGGRGGCSPDRPYRLAGGKDGGAYSRSEMHLGGTKSVKRNAKKPRGRWKLLGGENSAGGKGRNAGNCNLKTKGGVVRHCWCVGRKELAFLYEIATIKEPGFTEGWKVQRGNYSHEKSTQSRVLTGSGRGKKG